MSNVEKSNPVSPKVSYPFFLGLAAMVAEVAATQNWDEANWIGSALIVAYALLGYLVNDPKRVAS